MDMLGEMRGTNREYAFVAVIRHQPIPRVGRPEDVAAVVSFLAGPRLLVGDRGRLSRRRRSSGGST